MSAPWKGHITAADFTSIPTEIHVSTNAEPFTKMGQPVIVCPIDDESLPHPGDGKEWEVDLHGMWEPVVVRMPAIGPDGHERIVVSDQIGVPYMIPPRALRERKPEPEHKPWCNKRDCRDRPGCPCRCTCEPSGDHRPWCERATEAAMEDGTWKGQCWCYSVCDPRSGEEQREGERRADWPHDVSFFDRRRSGGNRSMARRGRRSGKDRRSQ